MAGLRTRLLRPLLLRGCDWSGRLDGWSMHCAWCLHVPWERPRTWAPHRLSRSTHDLTLLPLLRQPRWPTRVRQRGTWLPHRTMRREGGGEPRRHRALLLQGPQHKLPELGRDVTRVPLVAPRRVHQVHHSVVAQVAGRLQACCHATTLHVWQPSHWHGLLRVRHGGRHGLLHVRGGRRCHAHAPCLAWTPCHTLQLPRRHHGSLLHTSSVLAGCRRVGRRWLCLHWWHLLLHVGHARERVGGERHGAAFRHRAARPSRRHGGALVPLHPLLHNTCLLPPCTCHGLSPGLVRVWGVHASGWH
mmetsp:Transcript_11335/g.27761  ORF Transcript_11335/g.27761 Transcript_11335/m.27761 type:complete len:302 (-) Transcript_11335:204-1109(-)